MSGSTMRMAWDCGEGCPPIHVSLPITALPEGAGVEIGMDKLRRTVDVHMQAVHS